MKKIAVFSMFLFVGTLLSCEKNDLATSTTQNEAQQKKNDDVKVVNGRLVFKDKESFTAKCIEIGSKTFDEQLKWVKSLNFSSLRIAMDEINKDRKDAYLQMMKEAEITPMYTFLLNSQGECQIGDEIVWFDGLKSYLAKTEKNLQEIKSHPENFTPFSRIEKKVINQSKVRLYPGASSQKYNHQLQYTIGPFQYKYVNEIVTFTDSYGGYIFLDIKFEYSKPSWCCWYDAGDARSITGLLTFNGSICGWPFNSGISIGESSWSGTYQRLLAGGPLDPACSNTNIEISGWISHTASVAGSPTHYESNSPLW